MFNKSPPKVKFQDQQLDDYILEVCNLLLFFCTEYWFMLVFDKSLLDHAYVIWFGFRFFQNSVLKSKLQSKLDALTIMGKELDKCSMERDRYKLLVEQFKSKKSSTIENGGCDLYKFTPTNTISGGDMLAKTRDQNNLLKLEVSFLTLLLKW